MSLLVASAPIGSQNTIKELFKDEPLFAGAALVITLTMIPTLVAMGLDSRTFQLESPWIKPFKFQVALAIYLFSLAFYARWLPEGMVSSRRYKLFAISVVGAIALESLWINGAAAFAVASHFNTQSAIMGAIYGLMGLLATLLTAASTVYGVAIWRNHNSGLSASMRSALGLGLVLTLPLTLLVAGYMAQQSGHFVGTPVTHRSLPIMGWSTEVGDLRIAHFLATHALHVIPLAALVLAASVRMVWLIAAAFTLLTLAVFFQAVLGLPLIAL